MKTNEVPVKEIKIGARVKRGKDWEWGNQDSGKEGVIIQSNSPSEGWVRVRWDKGGENNYRIGYKSGEGEKRKYDLYYVQPLTHTFKKGDRVRKGPDWCWGDQDGNVNKGTVTEIRTGGNTGWAMVRWDNGDSHTYRIGYNNKIDIELMEVSSDELEFQFEN